MRKSYPPILPVVIFDNNSFFVHVFFFETSCRLFFCSIYSSTGNLNRKFQEFKDEYFFRKSRKGTNWIIFQIKSISLNLSFIFQEVDKFTIPTLKNKFPPIFSFIFFVFWRKRDMWPVQDGDRVLYDETYRVKDIFGGGKPLFAPSSARFQNASDFLNWIKNRR